ncbi:MAG TPA: DUF421 domain-containing protein [Bacillota bacterium]|nr:DUF421 domain-containing protein [Bacillota bacterium]HPT86755.1 DUF421 domain-containing protein [Bacillota bacterium]
MLILPFRTIILYLVVVLIIRIMGKHQVGQLQPYELVITIMISELAAVPMQDTEIPLLNGIIPILTLLLIQVCVSLLSLKSPGFRRIISGEPSIIINQGRINQQELIRLRYSLSDLLEQLRLKGIPNVADVDYAILETSGKLSVIPKTDKRPVTPGDLALKPDYEGLPVTLVEDGVLKRNNLKKAGISEEWLLKELRKKGLSGTEEAFLVNHDASGKLFIQAKVPSKGNRNS